MSRPIPVQNIYYLMLYAWKRLPEGRVVDVSGSDCPDLPNLMAKVLIEGVRNLMRRGLDRDYVENDEDLTRPRGRMRISETLSRNLISRLQIACSVDDLSRNILHNQILKVVLARLRGTEGIEAEHRDNIAAILSALPDIDEIPLTARDFGRVQLHGNNAAYGFLLRLCALAHECLAPAEGPGRYRFRDITASPQEMGLIFQDFISNFFELEQQRFSVRGETIRWDLDHGTGFGHELMPRMNTDVSLSDGERTIIIECKWTPRAIQTYRGSRSLRSSHLYQLHTYMAHHAQTLADTGRVEGLLLYPFAEDEVDVAVPIKGQWVRVRTLRLNTDWQDVHAELLGLLEDKSLGKYEVQSALVS